MRFLLFLFLMSWSLSSISQDSGKPILKLGEISNGDKVTNDVAKKPNKLVFYNTTDSTINENYQILEGTIQVSGKAGMGKVQKGGFLDDKSLSMLDEAKGTAVSIKVTYLDDKDVKRSAYLKFSVTF